VSELAAAKETALHCSTVNIDFTPSHVIAKYTYRIYPNIRDQMLWPFVVACICVCVVCNAQHLPDSSASSATQDAFREFVVKYRKIYDAPAYNKRLQIFEKNLEYIEEFNRKNPHMTLGVTEFADLTHEEYLQLLPGPRGPAPSRPTPPPAPRTPPASIDWRNKSVVGPVLAANNCDTPAYATVGSVASFCAITVGKFQFYDPGQVAQCIPNNCGAAENNSWDYTSRKGLHVHWNTTFCAAHPTDCCSNTSTNTPGCCINNYLCFSGNEFMLQTSVGILGPITVAVDGSQPSFQHYKGGIYYEPQCSSSNLNQDLLVVGYGTQGKQDFWIAQNFMGAEWGVQGYILMARNQNNNCGIASHQCHPVGVHQCAR